ncbi:transposase [Streptomyces sp. NPDC058008]|uniref:transposase n=1 Tax=Streptomyces sp. NPDC058008 TaxID=3346303 RepID=UPI0036E5CA8E
MPRPSGGSCDCLGPGSSAWPWGGGLTHQEWARLTSYLSESVELGGRRESRRWMVNGIPFRQRTKVPWRDLPARSGRWRTVYERHRRGAGQRMAQGRGSPRLSSRCRDGRPHPHRLVRGECGLPLLPRPPTRHGSKQEAAETAGKAHAPAASPGREARTLTRRPDLPDPPRR